MDGASRMAIGLKLLVVTSIMGAALAAPALVVAATTSAVIIGLVVHPMPGEGPLVAASWPRRRRDTAWLTVGALVAPAAIAAIAGPAALGGYAVLVAAWLGARTSRPTNRRSLPAAGAVITSEAVQRWSDDHLREQWRTSSSLLDAGGSRLLLVARVAAVRSVHLDEFERRDPAAFAVWLGDGARAGSDPFMH